ncbi:hypothetical protein [Aeromonas salmonicida]|uniref:hypothetical protein n=1 Tax=Aeromonas salmonicida TaxID=645 RepID=UPI003F7B5E87
MTHYSKMMKEINKIISFCMMKGVQPQDLIASIFESEYHNIETYKKGEHIYLVLTYSDVHDDGVSSIKMRYIYNNKQQLLSIEQKIDSSSYKVQWDRNKKLDEMLNNLALNLPEDSQVIDKLKAAIPDEYKVTFYSRLKLAC